MRFSNQLPVTRAGHRGERARLARDGRAQRLEALLVVRAQRRLALGRGQPLLVVGDLLPVVERGSRGAARARRDRRRRPRRRPRRRADRDGRGCDRATWPRARARLARRPSGRARAPRGCVRCGRARPSRCRALREELLAVGRAAHVHERDDDARAARAQRRDLGARGRDGIARGGAPGAPARGIGRRRRRDAEDADLDARDLDDAIGGEQEIARARRRGSPRSTGTLASASTRRRSGTPSARSRSPGVKAVTPRRA